MEIEMENMLDEVFEKEKEQVVLFEKLFNSVSDKNNDFIGYITENKVLLTKIQKYFSLRDYLNKKLMELITQGNQGIIQSIQSKYPSLFNQSKVS